MLSRDLFREEVEGVLVVATLTDGLLTIRVVSQSGGIETTVESVYGKARVLTLWEGLDDIRNWGASSVGRGAGHG